MSVGVYFGCSARTHSSFSLSYQALRVVGSVSSGVHRANTYHRRHCGVRRAVVVVIVKLL